MNRRTIITLILLLLLLLLLVAQAVTRPPKKITVKPPASQKRLSLEDTRTVIDEGLGEEGATAAESAPEEPKPIINVLNHSGWLNKGNYEVFGEIQNIGQRQGRNVALHVIFKDINFKTVTEVKNLAARPVLGPGDKTTFKVVLNDKNKSSYVGSYVLLTQVER